MSSFALIGTALADAPMKARSTQPAMDANQTLASWPPGQQLAGQEMMAKYGMPQEVTSERLVWRNAGPYKRITLTKEMFPHDFPLPHMDYLEHTISYKVPNDKTDDVHAFDASMSIYPVGGELSARCDLESNNVLTLNLANQVATGKKTVAEARKEFGEAVVQRTLGNNPPITSALQFRPQLAAAATDVEIVTIAGAPLRADANKTGDGEIMGALIALDLDEVHAATTAETKKLPMMVMTYAKKLHQAHGQNVKDTADLAIGLKVAAVQTPAIRAMHDTHAGALAKLVSLDGEPFAHAYVDLMVIGHAEALALLDKQLTTVKADALKAHLTKTRADVAMHLQEAKQLQEDTTKTSSR